MNLMELGERIGVHGFLHCNELEKLVDLAANRDVLEIGSFRGLSAWGMAISARSVLCVDTFAANSAGQQQMGHVTTLADFVESVSRFKNVRYFIGTSEAASNEALQPGENNTAAGSFVPHGQFDLIFLDAMHTYEDVKADIARWWPRVKAGGVMAFHDYGHWDFPGVKQAVDEVLGVPQNLLVTLAWFVKV